MSGTAAAGATPDWDASIILAFGGNLALPGLTLAETLERALAALPERGVRVCERSRFWRSAAWPDPGEPAYLNGVARVETALAPEALLLAMHEVEAAFGRVRSHPNAPRPVDLDLIAYGRLVQDAAPVLPHPRAAERLFVMGPLAEIAPGWVHPLTGLTARVSGVRATVGCDARPAPHPTAH